MLARELVDRMKNAMKHRLPTETVDRSAELIPGMKIPQRTRAHGDGNESFSSSGYVPIRRLSGHLRDRPERV